MTAHRLSFVAKFDRRLWIPGTRLYFVVDQEPLWSPNFNDYVAAYIVHLALALDFNAMILWAKFIPMSGYIS